jgi:hypothetical protein
MLLIVTAPFLLVSFALAREQRTQRKTGKIYLSVYPAISFAFLAPLRELYPHHARTIFPWVL